MNRSEARTAVMFALTTGKPLILKLGPTSVIDIEGSAPEATTRRVKVWVDDQIIMPDIRLDTSNRDSFCGWVMAHFTETR